MPEIPTKLGPYTLKAPLPYTYRALSDSSDKNEVYFLYEVTIPLARPHLIVFYCEDLSEVPQEFLFLLEEYVFNPPHELLTKGAFLLREELCNLLSTP